VSSSIRNRLPGKPAAHYIPPPANAPTAGLSPTARIPPPANVANHRPSADRHIPPPANVANRRPSSDHRINHPPTHHLPPTAILPQIDTPGAVD